jgi:hypothetical protein
MSLDDKKCVVCKNAGCVATSRAGPVCIAHTGYREPDLKKQEAVRNGARCPFVQGSIRYHTWWEEYLATLKPAA